MKYLLDDWRDSGTMGDQQSGGGGHRGNFSKCLSQVSSLVSTSRSDQMKWNGHQMSNVRSIFWDQNTIPGMLALIETSAAFWPTSTPGWRRCARCVGNLGLSFLKRSSSTCLNPSWSTFPSTTETWQPTWGPSGLISLLTWILQNLCTWRFGWWRTTGRLRRLTARWSC